MNNLESAEKKRRRLLEIIAIIIVLCIFLVLVFATDLGEGERLINGETATTSVDTDDETEKNNPSNIEIDGKKVASVATGANFTIALDSNGQVWAWGKNDKGQLGNGTYASSKVQQKVLVPTIEKDEKGNSTPLSNVKQIATGKDHAVALTNDGEVYVWGYNYYG